MRWMRLVVGLLLFLTLISPTFSQAELSELITNTRSDMEQLADRVFGVAERPEAWTGNQSSETTAIVDLWFDNEQLADQIFGAGLRPDAWIGASSPNASLVARNVRHDLEFAADFYLGSKNRPETWIGADLLLSCDQTLMNLAYMLDLYYDYKPVTPSSVLDYCASLAFEFEDKLADILLTQDESAGIDELIWSVRGDLERIADEVLGVNTRAGSWIGNKELGSPTMAADILADMNSLLDAQLGVGNRPEGWIGLIASSQTLSYRNLRHDVELMADVLIGEGQRPRGWQGEDPILRCEPNLQNLVLVVKQEYKLDPAEGIVIENNAAFCSQLSAQANRYVENPPEAVIADAQEEADMRYRGVSRYAFTYLDQAATEYMGIMPAGTEFKAWYRNFAGSTLMFVSGQDFALYIDRRWTTLAQNVFDTLPTHEGIDPLAFCDADWCNGPGPTPTPTGSGPLLDIISAATPPATLVPGQGLSGEDKLPVNWNHIRINYLLHRTDLGIAQVTLEICQEVAQITCEPVVSVFNAGTGTAVPVISQSGGFNVYEMPYGYSPNFIIEGPTLISNDIWLTDPTLLTPQSP